MREHYFRLRQLTVSSDGPRNVVYAGEAVYSDAPRNVVYAMDMYGVAHVQDEAGVQDGVQEGAQEGVQEDIQDEAGVQDDTPEAAVQDDDTQLDWLVFGEVVLEDWVPLVGT